MFHNSSVPLTGYGANIDVKINKTQGPDSI